MTKRRLVQSITLISVIAPLLSTISAIWQPWQRLVAWHGLAFPRSFFHGLHWWQFDLSAGIIRLLEWCGLTCSVWRITAEHLAARSMISRSASEPRAATPAARKG
jgi:hypothetical protein